jgi:uncharacterized protein (TIGR03437 family)
MKSIQYTYFILLACAGAAYGQAIVTTAAGGGFISNVPALKAYLNTPQGVAVDSSGNLYVTDLSHILRIDHATGILTAVAGAGPTVYTMNDGPALSVRMAPTSPAINPAGNILFLDSGTLRVLNLQQATVTTLAGQYGENASSGDGGPASAALLNQPQQICVDASGNIYIVEMAGYVRRIDGQTSVITTIAGTGSSVFAGDGGPAKSASLVRPTGIAVDSSGNIYIADTGDVRIRKIGAGSGIITTIAGTGRVLETGDGGPATAASFVQLGALAIDSKGNVWLTDGDRVRRITISTGTIATVAGNGTAALSGDGGLATQAAVDMPSGLAIVGSGDLYIADTGNERIRLVTAAGGIISTVAGTSQNGDGGLAAGAVLNNAQGAVTDASGNLFIAQGTSIREVNAATGMITTFAGGGTSTQDGVTALQAKLSPISLTFDAAGNLIVGEAGLIRRINSSGIVTTIAGTGATGYSGDNGPATAAQVGYVSALAIDSTGGILFVDSGNKRVRRIDGSSGIVTTVAGNGGNFGGLGVTATSMGIGSVAGVAVDGSGNIYIGGLQLYYLLKISPAGAVSVAGGIGGCGYIGDGGPATLAGICQPTSIVADAAGNVFVGDTTCYCVRRIAAGTGIIQTVLGTGAAGYSGDGGAANLAQLRSVSSIALFGTTLYVTDGTAGTVRAVTPDTPPAMPVTPSFSALVSSASFQAGPVAPGELISFYGHYLGPASPTTWILGSDGKLTIPNANVQVFFDDVAAPLVYISAGQVNAVAPYSVANGFSTVRVVTAGGTFTNSQIGSAPTAPGIFPSAIVNENGTINSPANPAPVGSYVQMYGTGLGQTTPAGVDGTITPTSNYPKQVYSVAATIATNPLFSTPLPMNVFYAGPAPGLAAGVSQINAFVPAGTSPGENFLQIDAGTTGASPAIVFWVQ